MAKSVSATRKPRAIELRYSGCDVMAMIILPSGHEIDPETANLPFNLSCRFVWDAGDDRIDIDIQLDILQDSEEPTMGQDTLVGIIARHHFFVEHKKSLKKNKDGSLRLPMPMHTMLISVSVGATRGLLMSKLDGTTYRDFVLPLIPLRDLLTQEAGEEIPNLAV